MQETESPIGDYHGRPERRVHFPSLHFYPRMIGEVWKANRLVAKGAYNGDRWLESSRNIMGHLESAGIPFDLTGRAHLEQVSGPCIFLGNHMSTMETFIFPWVARCRMPMTFVIKDSLTRYPLFGPVVLSQNPVVVGRKQAREDLVTVLREGENRLREGTSIIIFPQTTRTRYFDSSQFNTIGVKLARRAGVPVIPVAIQSDAWGSSGWPVKDFGRIHPDRPARLEFGAPMEISGSGKAENQEVVRFIGGRLREWGFPVEIEDRG